jgi:hypothetical protein
MAQFGSGRSIIAQNQSAVADSNGNLIVSPDDSFGASPLGVAARTQALYGIPNANFDILPSDPYAAISSGNVLPYWDTVVSGEGTATMVYTDATQSWAVRLDPTAGTASGETITMRARTYLLNDSNLTLRQKAFASIAKVGTQATSEWNLILSATYYDEAGTQLSTYDIGTANSGSAWTTINGFTTSGTAAIDPAAHYADLALTLTTSGSVSGTAMVDLNSLLIQTSTGGGGGASSFLLTETFLASGDFVVPTGVEYVSVVGQAGGNGGNGGAVSCLSATFASAVGGNGGGGPYWIQRENIYVGGLGTISVGIGAGGSGGTATSFTKAAAGTTTLTAASTAGGAGGNTTFGSLLTIARGSADVSVPYGVTQLGTVGGGGGGSPIGPGSAAAIGAAGNPHPLLSFTSAPFTTFGTAGSAGGDATGTGGLTPVNGTGGAANGTAGIASGGGGGGGSLAGTTAGTSAVLGGNGGVGGRGGGGSGGGAAGRYINGTVTITGTAGDGADGTYLSAGGGGGGAVAVARNTSGNYNASTITVASGAGGDGYPGWLTVYYVA